MKLKLIFNTRLTERRTFEQLQFEYYSLATKILLVGGVRNKIMLKKKKERMKSTLTNLIDELSVREVRGPETAWCWFQWPVA